MTTVEKNHHRPSAECAGFQARLPELFESGDSLEGDPHLASCETCSALVEDLRYIAQQAKLLLPLRDPSPAVWDHIQSALKREKEASGA